MRAVSLAIILVTAVTFFAVIYSAYEDGSALTSVSRSGSTSSVSEVVITGTTAHLFLNTTVSNSGLLPFQAEISCPPSQQGVTCTPSVLTLQPGAGGTLRFEVTVANYTRLENNLGGLHLNGTMSFALVPFASLSVEVDFGSLISKGGG
jgi:hypothetical protein